MNVEDGERKALMHPIVLEPVCVVVEDEDDESNVIKIVGESSDYVETHKKFVIVSRMVISKIYIFVDMEVEVQLRGINVALFDPRISGLEVGWGMDG